jgi:aspartyl protease family protein
MRLFFQSVVALCACVASQGALAAEAAKDVLKENGLTKVGDRFVLADETAVLNGMKGLRAAKNDADREVRARIALDNQIALKQKILKDADKEWHTLDARLAAVTKPDIKNNIIIRMNRLVSDAKQAEVALKDLEEQSGKQSVAGKAKFVDGLIELNSKAVAANAKYATLAKDAAVNAAVTRAGGKLGPSPEFVAAANELKSWQGGVESEAITLRRHEGTYTADVLLNGEKFDMVVDTGASFIALPWEVAEKLKMEPGEKDPVIQLKLANGAIIEGREMSISSVRVGRFTAKDVSCVVLEKGLPEAPLLLGGSFLNRFIVKLDPAKAELNLTEVKQAGSTSSTKPAAAAPAVPK